MQKLTITKLYINEKDKAGKPFMNKNGQPYSKIAIKTTEYGANKYITGFVGQWNANWRVGDVVECDVEENGEFLNLKRPDPLAELTKRVELLENYISNPSKIKKPVSTEDSPF